MTHTNTNTNHVTAETETDTHPVLKLRLPELDRRIARLNKRAQKLGLPTIGYAVVREYQLSETSRGGTIDNVWDYADVVLIGAAPRIEGFEFVARIDHVSASQNLIKRAPGTEHEVPEYMRTAPPSCNHCHTRRNRKDTFVLIATERTVVDGVTYEPGQFTRVGRTCLADFLRTKHADKALNLWALASESLHGLGHGGGDGDGGFAYEPHFRTRDVLAVTAACVRLDGWLSKTVARETSRVSTASNVCEVLIPRLRDSEEIKAWRRERIPTERDLAEADAIVEFIKSDEFSGSTDYVGNLKVLAGDDCVACQNVGLLVSAIACYRRHVGDAAKRAQNASKHLDAPVKARVKIEATVTNANVFDGYYGPVTIIGLKCDDGSRLVWKASGNKSDDVSVGARYHVCATVKAHDTYRGEPQTVVTRAKLTAA